VVPLKTKLSKPLAITFFQVSKRHAFYHDTGQTIRFCLLDSFIMHGSRPTTSEQSPIREHLSSK